LKPQWRGAPLTQRFADEIGADGYAPNAPAAVELAQALISTPSRRLGPEGLP